MHVVVDGDKWFNFEADYQHDGRRYSFNFFARSNEEAVEVLRAIRTTSVECKQISAIIPDGPGVGLWVRFIVGVRNLFGL